MPVVAMPPGQRRASEESQEENEPRGGDVSASPLHARREEEKEGD